MSIYHIHDWLLALSAFGVFVFWVIAWFGDTREYKEWVRMMDAEEHKAERKKHWTHGLDISSDY